MGWQKQNVCGCLPDLTGKFRGRPARMERVNLSYCGAHERMSLHAGEDEIMDLSLIDCLRKMFLRQER
jgi:hypothetical protein